MARALVTMPRTASAGEVLEIRALIAHPMETGYRAADDGRGVVPRDIVRSFRCYYGDALVFSAELFSAVAANPLIAFCTVATTSDTLRFVWEGDGGYAQTERIALVVL
jgi:sulfur-oxidizing protein SoxZ